MDIEDEDTAKSQMRHNIETEGQLVQNTTEYKEEQETMTTGPAFEVKEYSFADTLTGSLSQFRDKMEFFNKYRETKDMTTYSNYETMCRGEEYFQSICVTHHCEGPEPQHLEIGTGNRQQGC